MSRETAFLGLDSGRSRQLLGPDTRIIAIPEHSDAPFVQVKGAENYELWSVSVAHFGPVRKPPPGYRVEEEHFISGGNGLWVRRLEPDLTDP